MNFSERLFKFPYRVYEISDPSVLKGIETDIRDRKWVLGYKCIYVEDITSIADSFYLDTDIDYIIETGFNASIIVTDSDVYSCEWPLAILEKKINEHVRKVESYNEKTSTNE